MVFILFLNFSKVYYLANYSKGKDGIKGIEGIKGLEGIKGKNGIRTQNPVPDALNLFTN